LSRPTTYFFTTALKSTKVLCCFAQALCAVRPVSGGLECDIECVRYVFPPERGRLGRGMLEDHVMLRCVYSET
jgi:hypothetical protein